MRKKYDSTIARMAGNIAAGMIGRVDPESIPRVSVVLARAIVKEVIRTEDKDEDQTST